MVGINIIILVVRFEDFRCMVHLSHEEEYSVTKQIERMTYVKRHTESDR